MAKYTNGIHGIISGKVGDMVCSSWRGISYVPNAQFSKGALGRPEVIKLMPGAGCLTVIWHGDRYRSNCYGNDQVYLIIYEPESNAFLIGPTNVQRMHQACIMAIPAEFTGKILHTYLFCVSTCGKVSDTTYGGEAIMS